MPKTQKQQTADLFASFQLREEERKSKDLGWVIALSALFLTFIASYTHLIMRFATGEERQRVSDVRAQQTGLDIEKLKDDAHNMDKILDRNIRSIERHEREHSSTAALFADEI